MPTSQRRSRSAPPRAGRSWVWTAVMASVGAMTLAFAAVMVLELSHVASTSAPLIVIADSSGPTGAQRVTLHVDQVTRGEHPSVTVRLRNDSTTPVKVHAALAGGAAAASGTLTVALSAEGAVVRSGSLSSLTLPSFSLDALSTTPLTLELDGTDEDVRANWPADGDVALEVSASS